MSNLHDISTPGAAPESTSQMLALEEQVRKLGAIVEQFARAAMNTGRREAGAVQRMLRLEPGAGEQTFQALAGEAVLVVAPSAGAAWAARTDAIPLQGLQIAPGSTTRAMVIPVQPEGTVSLRATGSTAVEVFCVALTEQQAILWATIANLV